MILKSSGAAAASVATHRHERGGGGRAPLVALNAHLTCHLCKGYFIDATTIIECLHSFCRSCIVQYLESNKYCPVCDVQVHKTKPLLNIRPDKILQDIVYKLVPRLFQNEVRDRRAFYARHPEAKPSPLEMRSEASYQHLLAPDEMLCVALTYDGASEACAPRYLRCSAAVCVAHLQKLIRNKYDLSARHRVDVLREADALAAHLTLVDVAYIYQWRRKGPLALAYRIYEHVEQRRTSAEEGWKEVQLRISENGEMSVTGIQDCLGLLDATDAPTKKAKRKRKSVDEQPATKEKDDECKKARLDEPKTPPSLSNNHPLKKHSLASTLKVSTASSASTAGQVSRTATTSSTYTHKNHLHHHHHHHHQQQQYYPPSTNYTPINVPSVRFKPPPQPPPPTPPPTNDLRSVRPAKFFKMRNNMPRYLGCPASGVKPMYQVQDHSADEDAKKPPPTSTEIRRHSIVKIDPKTLKPIAERAPDPTSLSYNQKPSSPPPQDLKINTSSVSIFNPIKLQAERKSPHSPIGKRPTSSPTTPGPSQQQQQQPPPKASLGYTPPNPFVPTMSPNSRFMYPSPAGFPYDPMMAAFLAYSRAPFNYDFHKLPMPPPPPYGVQQQQPRAMLGQPQAKKKEQPLKEAKEKDGAKVSPKPVAASATTKPSKGEKSLQSALDKLTKAKQERETTRPNKIEIKSQITITPRGDVSATGTTTTTTAEKSKGGGEEAEAPPTTTTSNNNDRADEAKEAAKVQENPVASNNADDGVAIKEETTTTPPKVEAVAADDDAKKADDEEKKKKVQLTDVAAAVEEATAPVPVSDAANSKNDKAKCTLN